MRILKLKLEILILKYLKDHNENKFEKFDQIFVIIWSYIMILLIIYT